MPRHQLPYPAFKTFLRLNTYTLYSFAYSLYIKANGNAIPFTVRSPSPKPGINITIFFISTAVAFLVETRLFYRDNIRCKHPRIAFLIICLIGILFVMFTFFTPKIPLFKDPLINTYGINV